LRLGATVAVQVAAATISPSGLQATVVGMLQSKLLKSCRV
jgi:hypothetical protein